MKKNKVSSAVIKRLPRYRRYLAELDKNGVERISSGTLSEIMGYTASQIRQDLNNFGGFGQQGYGYNVKDLYEQISVILGLDKDYKVIIVGLGNLGLALANYINSYRKSFEIKAIFDVKADLVGVKKYGVQVENMDNLVDYVKSESIDIAIISTPATVAQDVADKLVDGQVRGIWNFATTDIEVPDHIAVENVHLSDSLNSLVYYINDFSN